MAADHCPSKGLTIWTLLALSLSIAVSSVAMGLSVRADVACAKQAEVRIQEWPGDIYNLVPWVADSEGLFRKHCLNVKFVSLASGPASYAAMVSGSIDFVNGAPDGIMRSRAKGVDLRLTSNMYAGQWSALVAGVRLALPHLDQGYPAIMRDLAGTKIGVTVRGGTTEAFMRSALEGAGMSASSVTFVAVGGVATDVPALQNGIVDAEMMGGAQPELVEALRAGKIILDLRKRDIGPKTVQDLWGATLSWAAYGPFIDKNPQIVAAFTAANNEAIKWIQTSKNRESVYSIVRKHMPLPELIPNREEALKRIVDRNAGVLGVGIPRASIDGWNKYLVSLGQISSPIPYEELVWETGRP